MENNRNFTHYLLPHRKNSMIWEIVFEIMADNFDFDLQENGPWIEDHLNIPFSVPQQKQ